MVTLYTIFDEAHQSFIPNRQPSLLDLLADSLGALLALAGVALLSRPFSR
jgi:VanZ family protein